MRLFFALLPDQVTRERVAAGADQLACVPSARFVSSANLHITLAFVGEVHDVDLDAVRSIGASVSVERGSVKLNSFEYWPTAEVLVFASRVNHCALERQTQLLRSAVVARRLARHGEKPWCAHVTVARKVAQPSVLPTMSPVEWTSSAFCLIQSRSERGESVYTVVDTWPLLDKA